MNDINSEHKKFGSEKKIALWILGIGALLTIFAPVILSINALNDLFILDEKSASVGDAIGGITAPIIGFIGSVLVFLALRSQLEANKIAQDQINEQNKESNYLKYSNFITEQNKLLREDIDYIVFDLGHGGGLAGNNRRNGYYPNNVFGIEATKQIFSIVISYGRCNIESSNYASELNKIRNILYRINHLTNTIKSSDIKDSAFLVLIIANTYVYLVKDVISSFADKVIDHEGKCSNCGEIHSGNIFDIFKFNKTIEYSLGAQIDFIYIVENENE